MEQLANRGNGNYTFIDSLREAQRAVVERLTSTIMVIAKDVKVQLEVNPLLVKAYRLLGYENRAIADHDFRNDQVDAGEIGAGHTVTALVEIELFNEDERPNAEELNLTFSSDMDVSQNQSNNETRVDAVEEVEESTDAVDVEEVEESTDAVDVEGVEESTDTVDRNGIEESTDLVEETEETESRALIVDAAFAQENAPLALLRLRAKTPQATAEDEATEYQYFLNQEEIVDSIDQATPALQFATAVAEFAEILRLSPHVEEVDFDSISALASESALDGDEYMEEFLTLVAQAKRIWTQNQRNER